MKVCPVCQYEEEQDSETSCAICGSDLEVEQAPQAENPVAEAPPAPPEQTVVDTPDTTVSTDEKVESSVPEVGADSSDSGGDSEISEEEKLLEETLAATEVEDSKETKSAAASFISNAFSSVSNIGSTITKAASGLDSVFKTKGKVNYKAPLTMVVISILLFFAVIGLAVSTVPGPTEESSDGYQPTTPYYKNQERIGTGVSEPFSGNPFNCEIWDGQIYYDFAENEDGQDYMVTDVNRNGTVDDDERFGCMVNMSWGSGIIFFALNLILLICILHYLT